MRLESFTIQNFKSIINTKECKISPKDNIVILAGQNESGKSATLEALDFFRNGPRENFERLYKRQKENPYVECKFKLEEDDFPDDLQNEQLEKYFAEKPYVILCRGYNHWSNTFDISLINFSKDFSEELENIIEQEEEGNEDIENTEHEQPTSSEDLEGTARIYFLKELEEYFVNKLRVFIFYPDFPNILPGTVKVSDIPSYEAVLDFQTVFDIDFAELLKEDSRTISREIKTLNERASDDLNKYWTQKLDDDNKYEFVISIKPQYSNMEDSEVEFLIDRQNNDPLYMEQKSKGFRWFSSFNLKLRAHGVSEKKLDDLIILIDEPGQGLHEKAQTDAKQVLEEMASKGAQVIYSTHNAHLINADIDSPEFSRIRLISNSRESGTKVQNISQYDATHSSADALSPIRTAMGLNSISLSSDKCNVVVEGITDYYYLTAFSKIYKLGKGIRFLPACGADQVVNILGILIGWNLKYKAILDGDTKGKSVRNKIKKHILIDDETTDKTIYINKNYQGIEDVFSKNDFHKYVLEDTANAKSKNKNNSEIAKDTNKKEFLARIFLDRVTANEKIKLNKTTEKNITDLFNWINKPIVEENNNIEQTTT